VIVLFPEFVSNVLPKVSIAMAEGILMLPGGESTGAGERRSGVIGLDYAGVAFVHNPY
jgi:hypothetical protein